METNDNTRAAIEELNEVLRYLFPIVPHKSHLVWSTRHRGVLINNPRLHDRLVASLFGKEDSNGQLDENEMNEEEEESEENGLEYQSAIDNGRQSLADSPDSIIAPLEPPQSSDHVRNHYPSSTSILTGILIPRLKQQQQSQPHTPTTSTSYNRDVLMAVADSRGASSSPASSAASGTAAGGTSIHKASSSQLSFILNKLKSNNNNNNNKQTLQQTKSPNKQQELTTPALGKRGPECMRRCIMQGLLHPVQCHSLC